MGTFAKLRKATISFFMCLSALKSVCASVRPSLCPSVCPSVRLFACLSVHMEQLGSHWTYFRHFLYTSIFLESVEKIKVPLKSDKNSGCFLHEDICTFDVHGSGHRKYILIHIQPDANLRRLFISGNCSTCFGCYFHSSSGAHTTVSTASGIWHTVTATCRYRGRVGTGLSVLWVAYATYSTLKPVPTPPR